MSNSDDISFEDLTMGGPAARVALAKAMLPHVLYGSRPPLVCVEEVIEKVNAVFNGTAAAAKEAAAAEKVTSRQAARLAARQASGGKKQPVFIHHAESVAPFAVPAGEASGPAPEGAALEVPVEPLSQVGTLSLKMVHL